MVAVAFSGVFVDDVDGRTCWSRSLPIPDRPASRNSSGRGRLKAKGFTMDINELKELALLLLSNYEAAWSENAALHVILDTYPMPDGSRGIPSWREIRDDWMSDPEAKARVGDRFSQLREQIRESLLESELLELLLRFPPVGGV